MNMIVDREAMDATKDMDAENKEKDDTKEMRAKRKGPLFPKTKSYLNKEMNIDV